MKKPPMSKKMPQKGMHMMDGMPMSDAEMKKMMGGKGPKPKTKKKPAAKKKGKG